MMKLLVVAALLGVAAGQFQRNPNQGRPTFGGSATTDFRPAPAPVARVNVRSGDAEGRRAIEREATITRYEQTQDENQPGNFNWAFESSDGSSASARGVLKPPAAGSDEPIQEIQGQWAYTGDDGAPIQATYVANELGFQVQSDAIPKPHPIPEAIRRSLDEIFKGIEAEGKLSRQEIDEIRARYNY